LLRSDDGERRREEGTKTVKDEGAMEDGTRLLCGRKRTLVRIEARPSLFQTC
jgi:hypothetical protein